MTAGPLIRKIFPVAVPSKTRLVATLKECVRLVESLPDPVCVVLEKSGVVASWRLQLDTLTRATGLAGTSITAGDVVSVAQQILGAVRRARR